jgi:endonuclease/exonuclease/phosphatase family metal-dependent hydrolase
MSGGGYTWSNNHKDPTLEKLDKVLMSKDWEALFSKVWVRKLPRDFSDHNPLIMATLCHQKPKVNEFKFELSWLK